MKAFRVLLRNDPAATEQTMIIIIIALIMISGVFELFVQSLHFSRKPGLRLNKNSGIHVMAARFWIICSQSTAAILAGLSVRPLTGLLITVYSAAFILTILLPGILVPRLIAQRAPDRISSAMSALMSVFALPLQPVYWLMHKYPHSLLLPQGEEAGMTEDELRLALAEGEKSGIVESKERSMVEGVFYLGDRPLGTFMTHRSEIQWLDINASNDDIIAKVLDYRDQRCFPVADGTLDAIMGAAYTEDIILDLVSGSSGGLRSVMKKALFAPETMPALKAFESFKLGKADFLFVMDEYGGFAGLVSILDLMEEIVGELTASARDEQEAIQQEDGSWLAIGSLNIDDAAELLCLPDLSIASDDYHTLAGFVLSLAGELPHIGDSFTFEGYSFIVKEMDGNRIEKIEIRNIKVRN